MLRNLLAYRLLILNGLGIAALAAAAMNGLVLPFIATDATHILLVAIPLFCAAMVSLFVRAGKVSSGINALKSGARVSVNKTKFAEKSAHLDDICIWLVTLALLANIIGFTMAVSGGGDLSSADGLIKLAAQFLGGMLIAFHTTTVCLVCALWLSINIRILRTATVCFLEDAA